MAKNKLTFLDGNAAAHLGDKGEIWFASSLPAGWVWQPPRRDFGKDGVIVIRDNSRLHNLEFTFQIKTSENHKIKGKSVVLSGVSRSSVQYWFASPVPTLIVALDIKKETAWYVWHTDAFRHPKEVFGKNTKTISINVPSSNTLSAEGWIRIREDLEAHYSSLQTALANDVQTKRMLLSISNISRTASNLMKLGQRSVPEQPFTEDEGFRIMLEQIDVRLLIDSVAAMLTWIPKDLSQHKNIEFWLESFMQMSLEIWPRLMELQPYGSDLAPDTDLSFSPHSMRENRPKMVVSMVELLAMLTRVDVKNASAGSEKSAHADSASTASGEE